MTPYCWILLRSLQCGTLSKAFQKSSRMRSIWLFTFQPLARSSTMVISWVSQDLFWNPCWASVRMLCSRRSLSLAQCMISSHRLHMIAISNVGQYLAANALFPFLNRGTTFALFHMDGTFPCCRDASNRSVSAGAISSAVCLSGHAGIPSDPAALWDFKCSSLVTPVLQTCMLHMLGQFFLVMSSS